ncbi:MAG TPA: SAM-dependent methyltransferase [Pseudonocardia sp.]|jgi:methyltransferase (TIGR00027 family)|nr:SAM-dependent methyltransferase [Pseudonocardia sp.]
MSTGELHDTQWDIVSSVGLTALAVASGRAVESGRADALIHDPWAARFVQRAKPTFPMPTSPRDPLATNPGWRYLSDLMGVRSRFFDDYLQAATEAGIDQVVVLAAGLDTRAYRMSWPPSCRWFEIDQPKVLAFKDTVLTEQGATARCQRHAVAADLRDDWAATLRAAGFDPVRPTAWLAEGLLQYLPSAAEDELFHQVDQLSSPGSRLACTHTDGPASFGWATSELGLNIAELVSGESRPPLNDRLRQHGWVLRASESVPQAGQRLGRHPTSPVPGSHLVPSMLSWASRD